MNKLADEFNTLPPDYQKVLQLAQETHKINVTPLMELKGGQTGANIFLVSVSTNDSNKLQHLVLKLDHKNAKSRIDELERHRIAVTGASSDFARAHIPQLNFNRVELDNSVAIFYNIAGQSLQNFKPLSGYRQQKKIEKIFKTTNDIILNQWNVNPAFQQAVHPQKVLSDWLGYRLKQGCNIGQFLEDVCRVPQGTEGLLIQGNVFPNPLLYARRDDLWGEARSIDIMTGFQHGDLNIGNILTKFKDKNETLQGYYLIDFALFKPDMPLFYDILYLQMSYLIRELSRVSFQAWVDLVIQFSEQDILDANKVPIELAGTCAVINAGRMDFENWVTSQHSSLSDDLWGQYRLAGIAVGLNYCNKAIITDTERLAGLIFAAAHLKRYHRMFGVSMPQEVKHINIIDSKEQAGHSEKPGKTGSIEQKISLPVQSTPFIGREKVLQATSEILQREDTRLLTLVGPGGTGKTRLSIQLATKLGKYYNDGIYFVDLAPVRDPESFFTTIAITIGLKEMNDRPLNEELGRQLKDKKLLFILDNFEQLTAATSYVVELIGSCPQLKMLVTSREPLHIRGERVFPVAPLSVPVDDIDKQSCEKLMQYESIRLFTERASAVRPDFEITDENAPDIARICSRLDGLPLAIELAAARISLFSPKDLLKRLDSRLKLLRGGARDLPVRQQTLEHTIRWSYELLEPDEQKLFALFSVFHGCTIEDVEAVAEGIVQVNGSDIFILEVLNSLVDKSLVRRVVLEDGEQRLLMLETIREYASERLAGDPELQAAAKYNHANYYADFSQRQWQRLSGNERATALRDFETNIENVRVAWHYWVSESDFGQLQKFIDCLWLLYHARGWYSAIIELTTDLLKVLTSTPSTPERSKQEIMLQTSLGRVMMAMKGCTPEVEDIYSHALELCRKYGEIPKSFPILRALASFYVYIGNLVRCLEFGNQILVLGDQLDEGAIKVEGNLLMGYCTAFTGDIQKGLEYLEQGIAIYKPDISGKHSFRFGNNPGIILHTTSALCNWMIGYPERSLQFAGKALALADTLDHPSSKIYALFHTGLLHLYRQEEELAIKNAETALEITDQYEFQIWKAVVSCLYGAALAGTGQVEEGITKFDFGLEMYAELNTPPIFWPMLLMMKAGVYIQAEKFSDALKTIEEAFEIFGQATGNPMLSELYRLKGDLLLLLSPDNVKQAETLYNQALKTAKSHGTKTFELRTAKSLARLWAGENKAEQGKQILREAIDKFTEGFESAELIKAKDLLIKLV